MNSKISGIAKISNSITQFAHENSNFHFSSVHRRSSISRAMRVIPMAHQCRQRGPRWVGDVGGGCSVCIGNWKGVSGASCVYRLVQDVENILEVARISVLLYRLTKSFVSRDSVSQFEMNEASGCVDYCARICVFRVYEILNSLNEIWLWLLNKMKY